MAGLFVIGTYLVIVGAAKLGGRILHGPCRHEHWTGDSLADVCLRCSVRRGDLLRRERQAR